MEEETDIRLYISEPKEGYEIQRHLPKLQGDFTQTANGVYDDDLSAYAQAVYGQLNRRKNNDTGLAFPKYETLMKVTKLSRASISKALEELIEHGWISIQRRYSKSNVYAINNFKTPNPINIQKRKENSETMKKAQTGKHPSSSPRELLTPVVHHADYDSSPRELLIVHQTNSINTSFSILPINTRDLKIQNLEKEILELTLVSENEENRKRIKSLAQDLRLEKYNRDNHLPE